LNTLLPGTQVVARGLQWEIVHIEPAGQQQRFRLRALQGDLRGTEFDLLHPFEPIEPMVSQLQPEKAGHLKPWLLYHQAFLLEQALGARALLAVQPGRLRIDPYQLVPVMRALRMSRPRLLLADGVGLGKTIQAGLVLSELIARRRAHRILIVSPAGPLLNQWHQEMRTRFGLRFQVIKDWATLQEARRSLILGANPFDHTGLCLTSIDFAKQEKVLQDLERTTWDVVVIDEAHHCVRMGQVGDSEDSRRRRLAEVLARQADGLLLLTATPHDGYDPHFASVVELLDPSLVDGRGSLRGETYQRHVIRRLKKHIRDPKTGEEIFQKREVTPCQVNFSRESHPQYAAFQEALIALVAPRLRSAVHQRRYGDVLAFVSLLKRSVSTVRACRNTLQVIADRHAELMQVGAEEQESRRQRLRTLRDYQRRLQRYGALPFEEEQDQAALEAEDMAAEIFSQGADDLVEQLKTSQRVVRRGRDQLRRVEEIHQALGELVAMAEAALSEDPKLAAIVEEVQAIRQEEPRANILIYTEYIDSQLAIVECLEKAREEAHLTGEVLTISGPDPDPVRIAVTERFSVEDDLILVSTDATAEGLNLHQRCHFLIHGELPFNPNRLEQRNGRIDRYGQKYPPRVRYLYLTGTFEERLLLRLIAKYERQRARLTFVPDTLGVATSNQLNSTVRLLEGLAEEEHSLFKRAPREIEFGQEEEEDTDNPAYQELLQEVERAITGFERAAKTHAWMGDAGLNAENQLIEDATQARATGGKLSAVDLLAFVGEAVESEMGQVVSHEDGTITLHLPPAWTFGLEDVPGYDAEARILHITSDIEQLRDDDGRSLGYIGRAHPIVRRALDRVRNVQFGLSDDYMDRRVTVARADGTEPVLLFTFLVGVDSGAGRTYERVLAVRVGKEGEPQVLSDPGDWTALGDRDRAVAPGGVWEAHFADWGMARQEVAREAAQEHFSELAEEFRDQYLRERTAERQRVEQWLVGRTGELCGPVQPEQVDLFQEETETLRRWMVLEEPTERLAAFANDGRNPPARRREGEGVLSLYNARVADLERRMSLEVTEPIPLGLLMLVPGEGGV